MSLAAPTAYHLKDPQKTKSNRTCSNTKNRNLTYQVYDLFITIPKMYTFISIVLNRQLVVSGILEIIVYSVVLQKTYRSPRITLTKTANASQFFDPATDFDMIMNRILIIHSFCDWKFIVRHS